MKELDELVENEEKEKENSSPELSAYEEYLEKYGLSPSKNGDYVDKEEFFQHMCDYIKKRDEKKKEFNKIFDDEVKACEERGDPIPKITDDNWVKLWKEMKPQVDDFISVAFMKIATHLSYRPNFNGYTYRSEFIGDAIENCLRYVDNFDPEKTHNPFAYFTQICWYSFVRRITLEQNQSEVKGRLMMKNFTEDFMTTDYEDENFNLDETIRNTHQFVELAYKRSVKEEEELKRKQEDKERRKREKMEKNSLKEFFV